MVVDSMKNKYVLVVASLSSAVFFNFLRSDDISTKKEIDQEIKREISQVFEKQKGYTHPPRMSKIEKKIDAKVKKEIKLQSRRENRQAVKDKLAGRVRTKRVATKHGKDFIYKIPSWPFGSIFYAEKDMLEIGFEATDATKAYSSGGSSQDMSKLIFGQRQMALKDILLASKLLQSGDLQSFNARNEAGAPDDNSHYFYLLADQPLDFDGSTNSQRIDIKYARHFMDGDISFGLDIPIVRRENKIRLASTITPTLRDKLQNVSPNFYLKYKDLDDFLTVLLSDRNLSNRGIGFNKKDSEWGFGDIKASLNIEFDSKHFERFLAGFTVLFPTAGERDTAKLWDPELGNGGFVEASIFSSFLWGLYSFFNPHVFVEVTGSIPGHVNRRVPRVRTYAGNPAAGNDVEAFLTLGGNDVQYLNLFSDVDVTFRNFSTATRQIKTRKGAELFIRLGNVFEDFFSPKATFDIFYDLRLKGRDYLSLSKFEEWRPSILNHNTAEVAHSLGFNFLYQFNGFKRFNLGGSYTVAGRNVPKLWEGFGAFSLEF